MHSHPDPPIHAHTTIAHVALKLLVALWFARVGPNRLSAHSLCIASHPFIALHALLLIAPRLTATNVLVPCRLAPLRSLAQPSAPHAQASVEKQKEALGHVNERTKSGARRGKALKSFNLANAVPIFATGGDDTEARVWNAVQGKVRQHLGGDVGGGHWQPVLAVAADKTFRWIATASADSDAIVWDRLTEKKIHRLHDHTAAVTAIEISSDGSRLVTGSWDGTAKIWDMKDGKCLETMNHSEENEQPGDKKKIGGLLHGREFGHDWHASRRMPSGETEGRCGVNAVAFSASGTFIVTGVSDGTARLWRIGDNTRTDGVSEHAIKIYPHAITLPSNFTENFTHDGSGVAAVATAPWGSAGMIVATGGTTGNCKMWNAISGNLLFTIEEAGVGTGSIECLAFFPREEGCSLELAMGCAQGSVSCFAVDEPSFNRKGSSRETSTDVRQAANPESTPGRKMDKIHRTLTIARAHGKEKGNERPFGVHCIAAGVQPHAGRNQRYVITGGGDGTTRVWEAPAARPEGGRRKKKVVLTNDVTVQHFLGSGGGSC